VPNAGGDVRWIMASPGGTAFLTAAGITPDFTWDNAGTGNIDPNCGMVCWGATGFDAPPPPDSWDATDPNQYVDCVAYGVYAGPTKTSVHDGTPQSGVPTPRMPGVGMHSLTRLGFTADNASDFVLACPTPENNGGGMGTFGPCDAPTTTTTSTTTSTTLAGPPRRSKCAGRKFQAVGAKTAAKARCAAKAAARGLTPDAGCLGRAEAAFARAWKKAERRAACLAATGDLPASEARVDTFRADVVRELGGTTSGSKCGSRKIKAVGVLTAGLARCAAKAFGKGQAVSAACEAKAHAAFGAAFARAERPGDCTASTGDAEEVRGAVVGFLAALRGALAP
jgi:hypothetical protein